MRRLRGLRCAATDHFAILAINPATNKPECRQQDGAPSMPMIWPELLGRPLPDPAHEIEIGRGPAGIVDLWLPDIIGPYPVILMVHGGCWQKTIADRTLMNYAAEELSQQGFAVWNIEYRGVDEPGGGYPGTFLDVAASTDALRDCAADYNLLTDNIIAFGHSAGGHLASWLAARPQLSKESPLHCENPLPIRSVVNTGGLADLEASAPVTEADCLSTIMEKLTGPASNVRPDVFADTSPAALLPFGATTVCINGDLDPIAPPVLGKDYAAKANAAGDNAKYCEIEDCGHVELIAPGTPAFDQTILIIRDLAGCSAS